MARLKFLLDHNVPQSVAAALRSHGHLVILVKDILPIDAPDALIAAVSEEDGSILVSCDQDFKRIAPRIPMGFRARFRKLSRLTLACNETQAATRMNSAMSLLELEWDIAQNSVDKRIHIVIQNSGIKTNR